jgi:hypothetical protein
VEEAGEDEEPGEGEADEGEGTLDKTQKVASDATKSYLGVGRSMREWAQQLGVDPYSTNETLQQELARVASAASVGSFVVRKATPSLGVIDYWRRIRCAGYERWLRDVSLPTSRLVDTTAAVRDRLIAVASTVTHSHGSEGEHEHTSTAFTTWLDPTLLIEQARATGHAFEREWPEHAAMFADRLAALVADLEALDAELTAATAAAADHPVLFSHPVYQYLEQRYGLVGDSLHWEPDKAPDDRQWAKLEHLLDHRRAEWMIWEAEPLAETSERLGDAGVRCAEGCLAVVCCQATPILAVSSLRVRRAPRSGPACSGGGPKCRPRPASPPTSRPDRSRCRRGIRSSSPGDRPAPP